MSNTLICSFNISFWFSSYNKGHTSIQGIKEMHLVREIVHDILGFFFIFNNSGFRLYFSCDLLTLIKKTRIGAFQALKKFLPMPCRTILVQFVKKSLRRNRLHF